MHGELDQFLSDIQRLIEGLVSGSIEDTSLKSPPTHLPTLLDIDYYHHLELVGTAHLSARSLRDAIEAVGRAHPLGITLELCPFRYDVLRNSCENCAEREGCTRKCEFVSAVEALQDTKLDVWLIDMAQEEIAARIFARASAEEAKAWMKVQDRIVRREAYGLRLWEEGLKDEAMRLFDGDLRIMRDAFPTLWRVLILERNALMACRLIHVVNHYFERTKRDFRVVVLTGAAHLEGLEGLLKRPRETIGLLNRLGVAFSPPTLLEGNGPK